MLLHPTPVSEITAAVGTDLVSLSGDRGPVLDIIGAPAMIAERLEEIASEIRKTIVYPAPRAVAPPRRARAASLVAGMRVHPSASPTLEHPPATGWVTVLSVVKVGRAVEVATDAPERSVRQWDRSLTVWAMPAAVDRREMVA